MALFWVLQSDQGVVEEPPDVPAEAVTAGLCGVDFDSPEGPAFNPENVCTENTIHVGPITNPAMQDPEKFAKQIFPELNSPAIPGSTQVLWRTWPEQAEVFVANPNPNNPPQWPDISGLDKPHRVRPSLQLQLREAEESIACDPGSSEEVRINRAAFDYIIENDLW